MPNVLTLHKDDYGCTGFHRAVKNNDKSVVEEYLKNFGSSCLVKEPDAFGNTPLHFAASHNYDGDIVRILIGKGADVNASNVDGIRPVHRAARNLRPGALIALIENGAKVDVADERLRTPLHHAIETRNADAILRLVKAGAKVNAQDYRKDTALHDAMAALVWAIDLHRLKAQAVVRCLLAQGADLSLINEAGQTPAAYAEEVSCRYACYDPETSDTASIASGSTAREDSYSTDSTAVEEKSPVFDIRPR